VKRGFNFVVATFALAAMLLLMTVAAMMVSFTGPGPILARHERVGHNGRRFCCYKFRAMMVGADVRLQRIGRSA
jgi:exopolysaccharide production protein ExoY